MAPIAALTISFCQYRAIIQCDEADLTHRLENFFQDCLGDQGQVAVTYRIVQVAPEQFEFWRDQTLLHPQATSLYVLTYLMRDLVAKLITACEASLVMHAAGLAYGQAGLILCGKSGSGKSTLSAWLTASGFDFLSDEIIATDFDPLCLRGFSLPIVLKDGSRFVWQHWLGDNAIKDMPHFFNNTAWINPSQLRAEAVCPQAIPRLLVFPQYIAGAPLQTEPLSAAEAAFHSMHQVVNFENLPDQGFSQTVRLAKAVQTYRLTYSDFDEAVTWFTEILGSMESG